MVNLALLFEGVGETEHGGLYWVRHGRVKLLSLWYAGNKAPKIFEGMQPMT